MKLQFSADLDYQTEAVCAVCDIFQGQEVCNTLFTIASDESLPLYRNENNLGGGNRLKLQIDELLTNVKQVQLRNGLALSTALSTLDFTVEMETGTGKTYVYLRSIFELNRRYGFTKFIIVVPSSQSTRACTRRSRSLRSISRVSTTTFATTTSSMMPQKLGQVRNFATSDCIQIMVINIDAFRRSFEDPETKIRQRHHRAPRPDDRVPPHRVHPGTNPIVIIDEPQSVDTTTRAVKPSHRSIRCARSATQPPTETSSAKCLRLDAVRRL